MDAHDPPARRAGPLGQRRPPRPLAGRRHHRREVRGQTRLLTLAEHIPALRRARVAVSVHLHGWRQADATNYPGGATVKAALDALVDAHIVPSDRPEHLDVAMPTLAPVGNGVPRVVLVITEQAATPPAPPPR